ncbi:hypothetical protein D3C81_1178620 [compost metagenome]
MANSAGSGSAARRRPTHQPQSQASAKASSNSMERTGRASGPRSRVSIDPPGWQAVASGVLGGAVRAVIFARYAQRSQPGAVTGNDLRRLSGRRRPRTA